MPHTDIPIGVEDMMWNLEDAYDVQGWPDLAENYRHCDHTSHEWGGRGTIAHITKSTVKKFESLPPEVHERLQKASLQLSVNNSISLRLRNRDESSVDSTESPISAVQQYELARFQLDCVLPPRQAPEPEPIPHPKPAVTQRGNALGVSLKDRYLLHLTSQIPAWETPRSNLKEIEQFRVQLNTIAQKAVSDYTNKLKRLRTPPVLSLQCFGGYRAGFALRGSDLDLVAVMDKFPGFLRRKLPYLLAQAFINLGFAAYVLPDPQNGPSATLRICQKPSQACLDVIKWETPDLSTEMDLKLFTGIPLQCHSESSQEQQGLHCNIYFHNTSLFLCKTDLLRCYRICDDRVYEMALFIKQWARVRRINDPYSGTLSSYGYILMLLHYLINVVSPPVLPNLQSCEAGPKELKWIDGCEVSFWSNQKGIAIEAEKGNLTKNHQSTASLLRGFFHFYSAPRHGPTTCHLIKQHFCWAIEVVSLRVSRPLHKTAKGWDTFKRDYNGGGSYHILAIEDPFELNHNVARMVDRSSFDLLRSEFRRAHEIIRTACPVPGTDLEWRTRTGEVCEDLFTERIPEA